jgi:ubiquinol-cytochrome c reductase cytochrome b subunit
VLVLAGPPLAFYLTRGMSHALTDRRRDEELHGRETGRIVMSPQGGYTEIREPVRRATPPGADAAGLAAARRGDVAARQPPPHRPGSPSGPVPGTRRGSLGSS